jgi:hypothetical protein
VSARTCTFPLRYSVPAAKSAQEGRPRCPQGTWSRVTTHECLSHFLCFLSSVGSCGSLEFYYRITSFDLCAKGTYVQITILSSLSQAYGSTTLELLAPINGLYCKCLQWCVSLAHRKLIKVANVFNTTNSQELSPYHCVAPAKCKKNPPITFYDGGTMALKLLYSISVSNRSTHTRYIAF